LKLVGSKAHRLAWSREYILFSIAIKSMANLAAKAGGWLKTAEPPWDQAFEFHKVWVYFARVFGIQLVGTIEENLAFHPAATSL
jgi:hypothetical protein